MPRDYQYDMMPEIKARYAVRVFSGKPVARAELLALVDAARFAPSCFNDQPWRFVLGDTPERFGKLADTLAAGNAWAKEAGALVLTLSKKTFLLNGEKNAYHAYDAGTASGFFQLEAVRRGLAVHSMAGFDHALVREVFAIPEDFAIFAMIAVGYPADPATLTEEQRNQEQPGTRRPLEDFIW